MTMNTTTYAFAIAFFYAVSMIGVATFVSQPAYAEGSSIHAKCHWYKQLAFKLKTEAAWNTYRKCLRGRF
jgi:hypothetical protein